MDTSPDSPTPKRLSPFAAIAGLLLVFVLAALLIHYTRSDQGTAQDSDARERNAVADVREHCGPEAARVFAGRFEADGIYYNVSANDQTVADVADYWISLCVTRGAPPPG